MTPLICTTCGGDHAHVTLSRPPARQCADPECANVIKPDGHWWRRRYCDRCAAKWRRGRRS